MQLYEIWHRNADAPHVLTVQERFTGERLRIEDKEEAIKHGIHCWHRWPACRLVVVEVTNPTPGGHSTRGDTRQIIWDSHLGRTA